MSYITKEDFKIAIKEAELNSLVGANISTFIKSAEATVFSYLRERYDIKEALKSSGDERDQYIVLIMVDIAVYNASKLTDMNNVPEQREQAYLRAIEWLKMAGKGMYSADMPLLKESGGDAGIMQYTEDNLIELKDL